MPTASRTFRPAHLGPRLEKREAAAVDADRRGTAASRGYGSRWQKARATFLAQQPLCCCCLANGRVTVARVVDHIVPHQGDQALFWDSGNWQRLCDDCNQRIKQAVELRWKRGQATTADLRLDRRLPDWLLAQPATP